jgi:hypothetical protein
MTVIGKKTRLPLSEQEAKLARECSRLLDRPWPHGKAPHDRYRVRARSFRKRSARAGEHARPNGEGHAVDIVPIPRECTPQRAAEFLNISNLSVGSKEPQLVRVA